MSESPPISHTSTPIERGNACLNCRKRKQKCDGTRPACGTCCMRLQAAGSDSSPCTYEDLPPGAKRRRVSRKQVDELEQKLSELQEQVKHLQYDSASIRAPFYEFAYLDEDDFTPTPTKDDPFTSTAIPSSSSLSAFAYPSDLPPIHTIQRIASDFISSRHPVATIFNGSRILARLLLPPSHPDFPHEALLHGLVSFHTEFYGTGILFEDSSDVALAARYRDEKPAQWHHIKAKAAFSNAVSRMEKPFDLLQCSAMMCHYILRACIYQEIWCTTGRTARMCVGLQLNAMPPPGVISTPATFSQTPLTRSMLLPPVRDEDEDRGRRTVAWWAITADRYASVCSGLTVSLQDDAMQTWLPSASASLLDQHTQWRALCPQSPDFFHLHPRPLCGGMQIFFKGMLLLGRSVTVPQRCQILGHPVKKTYDRTTSHIRAGAVFKDLERDLDSYIWSTSSFLVENPDDVFSSIIRNIPHLARILLHEQLCSADAEDPSMVTCYKAAEMIFASIVPKDHPKAIPEAFWFDTFAWAVAGRTFIRIISIRSIVNVEPALIDDLTRKTEIITSALRTYQSPHADNYVLVLSTMLKTPMVTLPQIWSAEPNSERAYLQEEDIPPLHRTVASLGLLYSRARRKVA